MGLHDRPYWKDDQQQSYGGSGGGGRGGMTIGMPRMGKAVKIMLVINVAVFIIQMFGDQTGRLSEWLGVTVNSFWQLWRYITFQFLHGGVLHILLNMLGLWFLGSPLERHLGTRRFVTFYLSCGVTAGIAYVIIGALSDLPGWLPIIGASGGVYGLVLAAAVLFPHFQIIFLFFPVPIRLAAIIIFGAMALMVLQALSAGQAYKAMSDVAHLGGAVTAAFWIWGLPKVTQAAREAADKANRGAWERKMKRRSADQAEIDQILNKIHEHGLNSLSGREKRLLRDATERERREESEIDRY